MDAASRALICRDCAAVDPSGAAETLPAGAEAAEARTWVVGEIVADLYEVRRVFTTGGMGLVYQVRHLGWDVDLAVKSPRADSLAQAGGVSEFVREAETWMDLGLHPHIVTCHYVRTLDGVPRVFAEYVAAGSLQDWIERGWLYAGTEDEALRRMLDVAVQFAWGLRHAHENDLVHRDVKPANVLLTPGGQAKVTDFGLAHARPDRRVVVRDTGGAGLQMSTALLTPAYCSPEQATAAAQAVAGVPSARRAPLTVATDVWSWAVSMLEVFVRTRTSAYGQAAPGELAAYLAGGPPEGVPRMPDSVAELVGRCLRVEPSERPQDFGEIADRLRAAYEAVAGAPYPREDPGAVDLKADSLNNKALSLLDLGRTEAAQQAWASALAADPVHAGARFNTDLLQWRTGDQPSDVEFVRRLEDQARLAEPDWWPHYLLSQAHTERGDRSSALAALDAAAERAPGQPELEPARHRAVTLEESGCLSELRRAGGAVHALALASDGALVASAHEDGTVGLWDTRSWECSTTFAASPGGVYAVAFSPDCGTIASTGLDQEVHLWSVPSGEPLGTIPVGTVLYSVAWSADGTCLAAGGYDDKVHLLSVARGAEAGVEVGVLAGHTGRVTAALFGPVPGQVISASADATLKVWDAFEGTCLRTLTGHRGRVHALALSRDGSVVVSGSGMPMRFTGDETVRLWSPPSERPVRVLRGHLQSVGAVALDPEATTVLSASADRTLRVWDRVSGRCRRTFDVPGLGVSALVSLPDDRLLLATSDGRLLLWGYRDVGRCPAPWAVSRPQQSDQALEAASAYGWARASAEEELRAGRFAEVLERLRTIRATPGFERDSGMLDLWHDVGVRHGRRTGLLGAYQRDLFEDDRSVVRGLALAPDGRYAVSVGGQIGDDRGGGLVVRDLRRGAVDRRLDAGGGRCVALTPDGGRALVGGDDGSVREWELASGRCLRVLEDRGGPVLAVAVSPDGRRMLSGGAAPLFGAGPGSAVLWNLADGTVLERLEGHTQAVSAVAFGVDEAQVVTASHDGTVRLWDPRSGRSTAVCEGHVGHVTAVAITPDGRTLVSVGDDASVRLWDLPTGRRRAALKGHRLEVRSVAVAPDGRFVASGSVDHSVRLWSLADRRCVHVLSGHREEVTGVAFTADGRLLASAGLDHAVRVWELDWDYEFPPAVDWDEAAEPYVRQLLARLGSGSPDASDVEGLVRELQRRGLGWIRPDGVRRRLARLESVAGQD